MNRKAITPLVSTLVLLIFAVGLGILVMSWGTSHSFQEDTCDDTKVAVTRLQNNNQLCIDGNNIKAIVENNGFTDIRGVELILLTKDNVIKSDVETTILPGEFAHITFTMDEFKNILKARLIPKVGKSCTNSMIEVERIDNCAT